MFVAASTNCFPYDDLATALQKLIDLEYQRVEIALHEGNPRQLKPSQVAADLESAIVTCRNTSRMTPVAYSVDIQAEGEEFYRQFAACCRLAKATKVVSLTVPSAELGTPFNAEVERLRHLVRIAALEGVLVSIRTQIGCMSQDPDTVVVLCRNVKGLGVTLDPSHYICGPHGGRSFEQVMPYVYHTLLRDSSKDQLQVRIGQGDIEYGRLMAQLEKVNYQHALCVHITEIPDSGIDHFAELRKMRLLLESMLR